MAKGEREEKIREREEEITKTVQREREEDVQREREKQEVSQNLGDRRGETDSKTTGRKKKIREEK